MSGNKSPECQHVNSRNCLLAILACRSSSGLKMADSATWSLREPRVVTNSDHKFPIHDGDDSGRDEYRISNKEFRRKKDRLNSLRISTFLVRNSAVQSLKREEPQTTNYRFPCRQFPSTYRQQDSFGALSPKLAGSRCGRIPS